jgi:hypothetical protein
MAYKTIFEELNERSGGATQSRSWYRSQVFQNYQADPSKLIRGDQFDEADRELKRDRNVVRSFPKLFSLMFYQYKAKTRRDLPFYDKYPLTFVLDIQPKHFFGVNLHYYSPEERMGIAAGLAANRIPKFEKGAHKYLYSELRSPLLDLAEQEWQTICLLPVEEFVRDLGGVEIPILSERVWGR